MKRLLLDTSVIVDSFRRKDKLQTPLYKLSEDDLSASIITHAELYSGRGVWEKKEARRELEDAFLNITILELNTEISQEAGHIKSLNPDVSLLDCIIAATAIYDKLELVTLNTKHFKKIKGLKLLDRYDEIG